MFFRGKGGEPVMIVERSSIGAIHRWETKPMYSRKLEHVASFREVLQKLCSLGHTPSLLQSAQQFCKLNGPNILGEY